MYLFLDTETTGFPKAGGRVCQLGALLTDEQGKTMAQLDVLIKPAGWVITPQLTAIHGILHSQAEAYGVPIIEALEMFESFIALAKVLIAHNFPFDKEMIDLEHGHLGVTNSAFNTKNTCCTMQNATQVCKIPNSGGRAGYKWPKLLEAHMSLFGEGFDNAHSAMADVYACKRIFFELMKRENAPTI